MTEPTLRVENLRTHFHTRQGVVKAVEDVSFAVWPGKILGLERIAVIAALNIAHELLSLRQQTSGETVSPGDIALLLQRMETAIADTAETEIR